MKGKGIAAEDFHLEHYFAKYEFVAKYLLCCSGKFLCSDPFMIYDTICV